MITAHSTDRCLGLRSAEMEQVAEAISLIASLMLSSASSSYLVTESLGLMQLEAGMEKTVIEQDFSQHGTLVALCWLSSFWEFTQHFKLLLHIP